MSSFRRPEGKRGSGTLAQAQGGLSGASSAISSSSAGATTAVRRQHRTSSGLRELDRIVGGGLPYGSITLIGEDQYSHHAATVLNYSIAEAICQRHDVLIIAAHGEDILSRLPFDLSQEPDISSSSSNNIGTNSSSSGASARGTEEAGASASHLKIAWQYGKYLNESTDPSKKGHFAAASSSRPLGVGVGPSSSSLVGSGTASSAAGAAIEFCHSFDLARSLQQSIIERAGVEVFSPQVETSISDNSGTLRSYLEQIWGKIHSRVTAKVSSEANSSEAPSMRVPGTGSRPLRLFLPALGGLDRAAAVATPSDLQLLMMFMLRLRHLVRDREHEITVSITTNAAVHDCSDFFPRLSHMSDAVFEVQSFDGRRGAVPSEYKEFCAFFFVQKLSNNYVLTPHHSVADQFGIKRSGRKLLIELLHLPPEDGDASGSSNAAHGHSCSAGISDLLS